MQVVDKHLALLAPRHLEARFTRINAERCKFLVDRLRIKMMLTVCIARDGKTVDYIAGLDDLGGRDDFTTDVMEWRVARSGVIDSAGDLMVPPGAAGAGGEAKGLLGGVRGGAKKKVIREKEDDGDSDDDF